MDDAVYKKLAKALDSLPNGFPATETGLEIKILKKIFTPEEAELFCDLKLQLESAEQISRRTGRPLEYLEEKLTTMWQKGEIWGQRANGVLSFKMIPFIIGIYEFQLNRMDREFCELLEEYKMHLGPHLVGYAPSIMQVLPIEKFISQGQKALPYQQASNIIENGKSFMVNECICKKEKGIMDKPCKKSTEVCLGVSSEEGFWNDHPLEGRVLSKEQAYDLLEETEKAGLVHLSNNFQSGHWFICNCCGCSCPVLQAVQMGIPNVINSSYYARIDPDLCESCGVCLEERCQVNAIQEEEQIYSVNEQRCIGCGLCISTCPTEAIQMIRKAEEEIKQPPLDEMAWFEERAQQRGVDISAYK